jgi:benzil reductase ((S)-benzoin forming)
MSLPDLSGRTAVITGASRGIGAGLARDFAARGLRLGLCSRGAPALPDGPQVVARQLDVTDGEALEAFARDVERRLGPIDLWINNAAVLGPIGPLREITAQDLSDHLAINVLGVFNGTRSFVRSLRATPREGVLINVSSGAALAGYAGWTAYCAGKAAVDRLTECVQLEEEAAGLRAYAVAPGVIDTNMQEQIRGCSPDQFPMVEKFHQLKRDEAFNSTDYVARCLLEVAFDPESRPEGVVVRLPAEKA